MSHTVYGDGIKPRESEDDLFIIVCRRIAFKSRHEVCLQVFADLRDPVKERLYDAEALLILLFI